MAKQRKKTVPEGRSLFDLIPVDLNPEVESPPDAGTPQAEPTVGSATESNGQKPPEVNPGQRRALDLSKNRVVSASAGTGKTFTLTTLYLGLLTGRLAPGGKYLDFDDWLARANLGTLTMMRPEQIVAVTFSEKAATELRERAHGALEKMLHSPGLNEAMRAHVRHCAHELSGAPVSTIHAFCARLLRETGAEGPVPAAFTVLEGDEGAEMLRDAFSAAAAERLDGGSDPFFEKLATSWGVFTPGPGLISVGTRMLGQLRSRGLKPEALLSTSQKRSTLAQIVRKLETFYDAVNAVPDKGRSKPKPEIRAICARRMIPDTLEAARLLALEINPLLKFAWVDNNNVENPCAEIVQAANGPYVESFAAFLNLALAKYTLAKRLKGAVDFDDLLIAARDLAAPETKAPDAEDAKDAAGVRFVLIDEFQDTNPLQKEILWRVAFGGQTPTSDARICVVGDVKQSIYRFRGADVTLMEQAEREFDSVPLNENFRSREKVIEFINAFCADFWPMQYGPDHRLKASENAARHAWKGPAGELLKWKDEELGNAEEQRWQQAVAIARRIRTFVAPEKSSVLTRPVIFDRATETARANIRFSDIAILANSLKNLRQPLQLALGQMRIPFQILGGVAFYTRQEVIDVTNLWAAACNPDDAYAVAGLLRSPFVGLSDEGLWRLSDACADGGFLGAAASRVLPGRALLDGSLLKAKWVSGLAADDARALENAAEMMRVLCGMAGRRTAVEMLDWALTKTGYLSILALQPRGEFAVAAVRKTIELARAFETNGNKHLSDFVRWLREQADDEWDDSGKSGSPDLASELPPDEDAVSIGTIHSAKGLEFPIVILPDLGARDFVPRDAALFTPEHGLGLKIADYFEGLPGIADTAHSLNAAFNKRADEEESLRKLYVAITRARDYIVLLGEGSGRWRTLVDGFRAKFPDVIPELSAGHRELKEARPGEAAGVIEYVDGKVKLNPRDAQEFAKHPQQAAKPNEITLPDPHESRVSVSRFAHWLWCPRQAAFEAEKEIDSAATLAANFNDGKDAGASGVGDEQVEVMLDENERGGPGAEELGTAVHAALEIIFGADEPASADTAGLAAEAFARAIAAAEDHPDVKQAFDRAMALTRSEWGRKVLRLPVQERFVERPFRWRLGAAGHAVVLSGQIDLLVHAGGEMWEVVDFKFTSLKTGAQDGAALARYAWQAGIYAQVAARILNVPPEKIGAALAFLKEDSPQPQTVEMLGHKRATALEIEAAAERFAALSEVRETLDLPAQRWLPGAGKAEARARGMCEAEGCGFVGRCFGK